METTVDKMIGSVVPASWLEPKQGRGRLELAEPDGKTAEILAGLTYYRQRDEWMFKPWTSWGDEFGGFGVPFRLDCPPNALAGAACFDWLRRGARHLLLTGETGTGKTTTLCWLMRAWGNYRRMCSMRYCTFAELTAEYQIAKRNEHGMTETWFWRWMEGLEVLAVDELVNRRAGTLAPELLYNLLDRAYSRRMKSLWLAGNIGSNALDEMSDEPELMRRRLNEAFIGGRLVRNGINRLSFRGAK